MKNFVMIIGFVMLSVFVYSQKIDSSAVVKAGLTKLIKEYSVICYSDSGKVNVRFYVKGSDTVALEATKEPPKGGYVYIDQKEIMAHRPFQIDQFLIWVADLQRKEPQPKKK